MRPVAELKLAVASFLLALACWSVGREVVRSLNQHSENGQQQQSFSSGSAAADSRRRRRRHDQLLSFESSDPVANHLRRAGRIHDNRDGGDGPYRLKSGDRDPSEGQSAAILKHLGGKVNGTFFEAGGHDGEFLSNSLDLELRHGWTGILVEPVPWLYKELRKKNRRIYSLEGCVSPKTTNFTATMTTSVDEEDWKRGTGSLDGYLKVWGEEIISIEVQCYPLISILTAVNLRKLDVLSLDVQGAELDILKTVPWELVDIRLIVMEDDLADPNERLRILRLMEDYLTQHGYGLVDEVSSDFFFLKGATTDRKRFRL